MDVSKVYFARKEIKQLEEEIKELTTLSSPKLSGMPTAHNPHSSVEQFVERLEALKEKLVKKYNEYFDAIEEMENFVESIEDAEIRVIARMRYVQCMSYYDIGFELCMDRTTAAKKLKKYMEKH